LSETKMCYMNYFMRNKLNSHSSEKNQNLKEIKTNKEINVSPMSQLSIKNWEIQFEKAILQGYKSRKAFVHEINEYFRKKHEGHLKILEDFKQAQEQKKTISSEIYENDLVKKYRSGQKISTPSQWIWDTEITKWVNGKKSPTNSKTLIPILEFFFEKNIMSRIEANEWIMNLKFVMPDKELHKIIQIGRAH